MDVTGECGSQKTPSFQTGIMLSEDRIRVHITGVGEGAEFAFYLYYFPGQSTNKRLVQETKYQVHPHHTFSVSEIGYYIVRCFVQREGVRQEQYTYSVLYLDQAFRQCFDQVMERNLHTCNTCGGPAGYFKAPAPQNDFCLVSEKTDTGNQPPTLLEFCRQNGMTCRKLDRPGTWNTLNYLISDKTGEQHGFEDQRVFSGYAWVSGTFYYSQMGLSPKMRTEQLYESCGIFSLLDAGGETIKITSDFFGYGRLFYYMDQDRLIVSNRYHLLLFVMRASGVGADLDEDIIYVTFASNVTLLRQTFTGHLPVAGTHMLSIDREIVLDVDGWHFPHRGIYHRMQTGPAYDPERYAQLIEQAKEELICNMRAIAECSQFEHIELDLSGGKDSRTILAAAGHVPNACERFSLRTDEDIPGIEPGDVEISTGISNTFGWRYCTAGDTFHMEDPREYLLKKRSYFCGDSRK